MPPPFQAGWELVQMIALPRELNDGQALGGGGLLAVTESTLVAQGCTGRPFVSLEWFG